MSGIFKGDSIYKSGGGGGGYKDGGALVDGDFIKVENNTISSYDNVSRDPVNFYFEVKDGEVLNSVVELTTAVNATINVYVVKNGLYFLLGNVGGNTVNAGEDYKINVVGNSFMLEVVTPSQAVPEFVELGGVNYPIIYNNGLLWLCSNYVDSNFQHHENNGTFYFSFQSIKNININGWRLPLSTECTNLYNSLEPNANIKLRSVSGWKDGKNGTNESGFNAYPLGMYKATYDQMANEEEFAQFLCSNNGQGNEFSTNYNDNYWTVGVNPDDFWQPVRLVKSWP